MKAIFKHEMNMYFTSISGYVFGTFVLLFAGIYTVAANVSSQLGNFEYVPSSMVFIFIAIIPVLTMRMIAEERRQKTDQLLYSLPISMTKVVLGKFFAALVILAIPVGIMCIYPLVLRAFGPVTFSMAYGSLLGFFLLGASLISMGMFISSLTESQAVAAGACFVLMLFNYFITALAKLLPVQPKWSLIAIAVVAALVALFIWVMTKSWPTSVGGFAVAMAVAGILYKHNRTPFINLFPRVVPNISLFSRFSTYINGVLDLSGVVYTVSVTAFFIFLTVQSLEKRRWS